MDDLLQSFIEGIQPEPILSYDEWAKDNFYLPPSSKIQGLIDFSYIPYLIEPLQCLSWQSPIHTELWMWGIQLAKTTGYEILLHANVDVFRKPLISYFGSDSLASEFVKLRFKPGIENNEKLKARLMDGYDKKDRSTIGLFILPGGIPMKFTGGITEKAYRHFSAAIIIMDDIDAFPRDVGGTEKRKGQGSPFELASNRKNARFGDYKIAVSGSPTDAETSIIYNNAKKADMRFFKVKCPFCGQPQIIDFWRLRHPKKTNLKSVVLECISCNRLIPESYKFDMMQLENGARWEVSRESDDILVVSRQLSSAYSLLGYSWDEMYKEFLNASEEQKRGNLKPLIAFYNTKLGLPWENKQQKKRISHTKLYDDREDYELVPDEAVLIYAGTDVQQDRIVTLVAGIAENMDIYCLEYMQIMGDTLIEYGLPGSPYNEYEKFLQTTYDNQYGKQPILLSAMDTGFRSIVVSPFLKKMEETGVVKIAGVFGGTGRDKKKAFVSGPTINKYELEQWEINTDEGKTLLDNKLKLGRIHFNKHPSFSDLFFRGLMSETFNEKTQKWEHTGIRQNEPFDTLNYVLAAFNIDTNGGQVDWESFRMWNKAGCPQTIVTSQSENYGLVSNGIQ